MLLSLLLPWSMRRTFMEKQFGYSIHPTARIGFAWILPEQLIMEAHSSIGTLTICKNIALLHLGKHGIIGRGNWITGFPLGPLRILLPKQIAARSSSSARMPPSRIGT